MSSQDTKFTTLKNKTELKRPTEKLWEGSPWTERDHRGLRRLNHVVVAIIVTSRKIITVTIIVIIIVIIIVLIIILIIFLINKTLHLCGHQTFSLFGSSLHIAITRWTVYIFLTVLSKSQAKQIGKQGYEQLLFFYLKIQRTKKHK